MFCTNCGKEIADDLKFCTFCGTKMETDTQHFDSAAAQNYTLSQHQQQDYQRQLYQTAPTGSVDHRQKKMTQALAVIFSVLTIVTILLSGLTFKIDMSDLEKSMSSDIKVRLNDVRITIPMFTMAGMVGQINGTLNKVKNTLEKQIEKNDMDYLDEQLEIMEEGTKGLGTAAFYLNVMRLLSVLTVLMLLIFIFLILVGNQNGVIVGQVGGCLAVATAIGIIIGAIFINGNFSDILEAINAPSDIGNMLSFGASIWVYLSILFGVLSVLFVTVRKNIIIED